jgi:diguanylate cyclase (GGDEF)-like protein/PAS domain S-box-containing protein
VLKSLVARARSVPHWAYLAANVPLIAAIFLFLRYHTFLWGAMGFGGAAAVVIGTVKNRPRSRLPWVLVAIALGTFISGDITYDVLTKYLHESNPFPSLADVFYLLTYPLAAAGLLGLVRARRQQRDLGALLDALIVTAGAALLSWIFLIQPYVHAHHMTFVSKAVSIAYPLGDVLFLCLLARLLAGGGLRNTSLRFLTAGVVGVLVADCVYGWIQLNGSWKVGGPTDLGWVAFYVLWGAAALHPSMRALTEKQPQRSRHISVATLLALGVATLAGPLLLVWRVLLDDQVRDVGVIAAVTALEFVLVMTRMSGLARAQAVVARRERALREFGERLVAATELDEVLAAAMAAVDATIGTSARACVLTRVDGPTERVVLSAPAGLEGMQVVALGASQSAPAEFRFVGEPPMVLGDRWTSIAVSERGGKRYRIVISHDRPLPLDAVAILDAVADQFVIALERVDVVAGRHQRRGAARFRSLVQNASDVIVVVQRGGSWRCETPSIEVVLGYSREAVETLDVGTLLHPDDADPAMAVVETMLSGRRSGPVRTEWRVRHADGRWLAMEVVASDLSHDPDVGGVVLTLRDVSDRRQLEEEIRHRAFHDGLTDLPNRVLFIDRVEHALSRMRRQGMSVSVLFLDVDDFKLVNDSLGHAAGDDLLIEIGRRLEACLREGDTAARLGGDEFAVCAELDGENPLALTALATRILDTFEVPFSLRGTELIAHASIGISTSVERSRTATDMLREADLALYAVKESGKGTFRFFEPKLHEAVLTRLARRAALEHAIGRGELRLHYQPIVRLADRAIIGLEALVRWQHPVEGLVPPMDFIPLAEESGLIAPLGEWVLNQACADLNRWQRSWPSVWGSVPHVSVNLSPSQLHSGQLVEVIDGVLARHGIEPSSLTLEITESCFAEDSDEVRSCVQELVEHGITLSLDDFGTGYSSLSYLRRFPLRNLKVDRSFVAAMGTSDGLTILKAIVSMARSLGLSVVAEGIEDEDQVRELRRLGCDEGQGFLFWRPLTADAIDLLLGCSPRELTAAVALPA